MKTFLVILGYISGDISYNNTSLLLALISVMVSVNGGAIVNNFSMEVGGFGGVTDVKGDIRVLRYKVPSVGSTPTHPSNA